MANEKNWFLSVEEYLTFDFSDIYLKKFPKIYYFNCLFVSLFREVGENRSFGDV